MIKKLMNNSAFYKIKNTLDSYIESKVKKEVLVATDEVAKNTKESMSALAELQSVIVASFEKQKEEAKNLISSINSFNNMHYERVFIEEDSEVIVLSEDNLLITNPSFVNKKELYPLFVSIYVNGRRMTITVPGEGVMDCQVEVKSVKHVAFILDLKEEDFVEIFAKKYFNKK